MAPMVGYGGSALCRKPQRPGRLTHPMGPDIIHGPRH